MRKSRSPNPLGFFTSAETVQLAVLIKGQKEQVVLLKNQIDLLQTRYEDFTTIDWVQDAAKEQLRRKSQKEIIPSGKGSQYSGNYKKTAKKHLAMI
jgi:hypothetical protein